MTIGRRDREISISHRTEQGLRNDQQPRHLGVTETNKASKRVCLYENDIKTTFYDSVSIAKANNGAGAWGVSMCDVVLMRHILEPGGCLTNENTWFTLLHVPQC